MDEQTPGMTEPLHPLVSVIMSVFNGEQFLQQAIESILSQTYRHWEFIIIDDFSNEATQSILLRYKIDGRFKIKRNEVRMGLTKNLNLALGICQGVFIARMDADDISLPVRLEEQVNFMQQNDRVVAVFGFVEFIDEQGNFTGHWPDDRRTTSYRQIKRCLPFRNCLAHPTVLIRKIILDRYRYNENQVYSQDWDLWVRLVADGNILEKINKTLLFYRVHEASVTKISNKKSAFLKVHQTYKRYLQQTLKEKKINWYNFLVFIGFIINGIKLSMSRIKKTIFPGNVNKGY